MRDIGDNILVKKIDTNISEVEEKLNGRFSVVAVAPERGSLLHCYNYLHWKNLPNDVKDNPDKYTVYCL